MTIFQKMLVIPILSFTLYTCILVYGLTEYRASTLKIGALSEAYLSMLEISNANSRLFKDTVIKFKDAVLAGEQDWVLDTNTNKEEINHNFEQLSQFQNDLDKQLLKQLQNNFNLYYTNALTLSLSLLKNNKDFSNHENLIQAVEFYSQLTSSQFFLFNKSIKNRFSLSIESSNISLNNKLKWGGSIAVFLLLLMVAVTTSLSLSTKKSFLAVIDRMRTFAVGKPDFSRRLYRKQKDELGYLIYWFNKLSDSLEKNHSEIEKISITDKLTQLSNRTHTDEYLQKQLNLSPPAKNDLIVIIADIDHFKLINDNHGHLAGDHVLREFSKILKNCTRVQDFVGRWGGEEFIIAMPDIELVQATKNADRLRQTIEEHDFGEAGKITASFGISVSIKNDTQESLIKRADDALYRAKDQGRNQVVSNIIHNSPL